MTIWTRLSKAEEKISTLENDIWFARQDIKHAEERCRTLRGDVSKLQVHLELLLGHLNLEVQKEPAKLVVVPKKEGG